MGSLQTGSHQSQEDTLTVSFLSPSIITAPSIITDITDTTAIESINPESPISPKTLTSLKEDFQNTIKNMSSEVTIESHEQTETHSSSSNPFAFTVKRLSPLAEPTQKKHSLLLLKSYGGIDGLIKGLHSNLLSGLCDETTPLKPITLKDITKDLDESGDNIDDEQDNVQSGQTSIPENSLFYQRIRIFGTNVLPEKKSKSIFELMWIAMQEKVLILLIIAAIVSLGLGLYEDFGSKEDTNQPKIRWVEGVAILIAIMIVVLVGSLNDWQKERQFQKLNAKKEDRNVKVTRNGKESLLSVHDILVGDVLNLEPGDIISVDGVLISGHNLRCDESAASGESDAVRKMKYADCLKELEDDDEGVQSKADPFIISGSKILEGVGTYLVTGIGTNSFYGKILISLRTDPEDTPLQEKLNDLAEKIAKLGGAAALLMLIVLLIKYFVSFTSGVPLVTSIFDNLIQIVISTVTIVVVAVPEGLPLAVTLALAYATTRMLKDNNLVRVLSACETMGNATTICSDKTGTLTQNKMTVVAGIIGLSVPFVRDVEAHSAIFKKSKSDKGSAMLEKPISLKEINSDIPQDILQLLNESIAINSTAFEGEIENEKRTFVGSKTETALLGFLLDLNLDNIKTLRENAQIVQLFPFNSERKSMGVVVKVNDHKWRFLVKGASEIILKKSEKIINIVKSDDTSGSITDLTQDNFDKVQNVIENYATQSLRTIGIAYRDFEKFQIEEMTKNLDDEISYGDLFDKLTLLSIVGIEDPLREGVRDAVRMCVKAGVKVRMVTGDNILTAKSIATQCGIYTGGEVMEGPEFRDLPPDHMDKILPKLQVLARSSPEDKRILVGRLRKLGDVVAVTGDGTNDGPALKLSDVGFSMGITGTEVAKEASSIILMDDNFSSIVKAILWGRNVNDSVKKFLQFQLTVNVTAVLLTFISAVSSNDQRSVLSAVQLLWVNLIMDTFAALALATDPPTSDLLDRKPEPRNAPLISPDMWKMIIGQSIFQLVITLVLFYAGDSILGYHQQEEKLQLQTIIFNTFVFLQIFNEINCRRLHGKINVLKGALNNNFLIIIFFIMVCGQFLIVEFGGTAFQVTQLSIVQWVICVVLGFLSIPVGIIIRLIPTGTVSVPPVSSDLDLEKEWRDPITQVQNQLQFFKTLRGGRFRAHFGDRKEKSETQSKAIAAAAMLPSLISASVGVHMTRESTIQSPGQDLERQFQNDDNEGINSSSTSKNQDDTNVDTIDVQKDS